VSWQESVLTLSFKLVLLAQTTGYTVGVASVVLGAAMYFSSKRPGASKKGRRLVAGSTLLLTLLFSLNSVNSAAAWIATGKAGQPRLGSTLQNFTLKYTVPGIEAWLKTAAPPLDAATTTVGILLLVAGTYLYAWSRPSGPRRMAQGVTAIIASKAVWFLPEVLHLVLQS